MKNIAKLLGILVLGGLMTGCGNTAEKVVINDGCVKGTVSSSTHQIVDMISYQGMKLVKVVHNDGGICDSDIHNAWFEFHNGEIEMNPYPYKIEVADSTSN